jgi:hypothetical protein
MSKKDCLFEVADREQGYFTSQQAKKAATMTLIFIEM